MVNTSSVTAETLAIVVVENKADNVPEAGTTVLEYNTCLHSLNIDKGSLAVDSSF
jgi:hypothetical protein